MISSPVSQPPRSVLVVDDDPGVTQVLVDTLATAGFAVRVAHDGDAAIRAVREARPALVLLDLWMPGIDGWGVAWALHSLGIGVPLVLVTAEHDAAAAAAEMGVVTVIQKPFDIDDLLATVHRVLEQAA